MNINLFSEMYWLILDEKHASPNPQAANEKQGNNQQVSFAQDELKCES